MQLQLAENLRPPPFKKIKRETEYNFKRIRNKRQFNSIVDILDDIQESIHHVENNDTESAYSSLTSICDKLKKRNKLIRIADKSEAGWLTIEEYLNDSPASNSDELRKICQTEQRGPQNKKQNFQFVQNPPFHLPRAF